VKVQLISPSNTAVYFGNEMWYVCVCTNLIVRYEEEEFALHCEAKLKSSYIYHGWWHLIGTLLSLEVCFSCSACLLGTNLKGWDKKRLCLNKTLFFLPPRHFFSIWFLCVCFRDILPDKHVEYFQPWVYSFGYELIIHSTRLPLISGFYKLLSVTMKIAKKIKYFEVRSLFPLEM